MGAPPIPECGRLGDARQTSQWDGAPTRAGVAERYICLRAGGPIKLPAKGEWQLALGRSGRLNVIRKQGAP